MKQQVLRGVKLARPRVRKFQIERACFICAKLMLRDSGYFEMTDQSVSELLEELKDLVGFNATFHVKQMGGDDAPSSDQE